MQSLFLSYDFKINALFINASCLLNDIKAAQWYLNQFYNTIRNPPIDTMRIGEFNKVICK